MNFQVSDFKERNFLELLDDDSNSLELSTIKGRLWLQYFGHSNSLCTRATRAIVNYAPIGEYQLNFSLEKSLLVHVVYISLNQDITFYTSVRGSITIGIQEVTLLVISLNFSYLKARHSFSRIVLLYQIASI